MYQYIHYVSILYIYMIVYIKRMYITDYEYYICIFADNNRYIELDTSIGTSLFTYKYDYEHFICFLCLFLYKILYISHNKLIIITISIKQVSYEVSI